MMLANELDVEIICGDGTELDYLEQAGTFGADCFIAVTGSDQDNLVASQLAKKEFQVRKVIARANNPLEPESAQNPGCGYACEQYRDHHPFNRAGGRCCGNASSGHADKGRAGICAITLPPDTVLDGMMLKDLTLPNGSLVISVVRGETMMIPNGMTVIHANDEIVARLRRGRAETADAGVRG